MSIHAFAYKLKRLAEVVGTAEAINSHGQIVSYLLAPTVSAFLWHDDEHIALSGLNGSNATYAKAINGDGLAVSRLVDHDP